MSNEVIDKVVIVDEDSTTMILENRMIEGDDFLVISVAGHNIYLNEEADLMALLKCVERRLNPIEPINKYERSLCLY